MEDVADGDYTNAKRVCKGFNIINLYKYHNLCVRSDTLLLADVFESFWNTCLERYELDPSPFRTLPGLTWHVVLKKLKLDLLTNINLLLMVEKGIICEICNTY